MKIEIEVNANDLKKLVKQHLSNMLNVDIDENNLSICVKSKQNYKSEWENADFKAVYQHYSKEI